MRLRDDRLDLKDRGGESADMTAENKMRIREIAQEKTRSLFLERMIDWMTSRA